MSSTTSRADTAEEKNADACPVVEAIEQIGSEWRLVVLNDLQEGEKRFNELQRSTGASSRTLSRVLDDLEEAGLVNRRVEDRPIATYYSLTEKSRQLCPVFDELESWADDWLDAPGEGESGERRSGDSEASEGETADGEAAEAADD